MAINVVEDKESPYALDGHHGVENSSYLVDTLRSLKE